MFSSIFLNRHIHFSKIKLINLNVTFLTTQQIQFYIFCFKYNVKEGDNIAKVNENK